MKRIETKGHWGEQIQNFIGDFDLSDAEEGWYYEDDSFGHEFGTEVCGRWYYESPVLETFEVIVPVFPIPDPWDEEDTIETPHEFMRSIQIIFEEAECPPESEQGKLKLTPAFTLHLEYGSVIDAPPFAILEVRSEWEEM